MKIRLSILLLFLAISGLTKAQTEIERLSWRMSALGFDMVECRKDAERDSCIALFNENMDSLISMPGSFNHRFDSVANIRILDAPNHSFRLLTWGFRHPNDSFSFFGILQYASQEKEAVWLRDSAHRLGNNDTAYHASLSPEKWYGSIYYQIEKIKYKKEEYYLLVGWNGNTIKTDRKVVDVLSWNEFDEPVFGLPIFDVGASSYQSRVIWEYKNGANMVLKIEPKEKLIVFEHTEPADSRARGIYSLYLPDGTYDFFRYKKGRWIKETMLYDHFKNPGRD